MTVLSSPDVLTGGSWSRGMTRRWKPHPAPPPRRKHVCPSCRLPFPDLDQEHCRACRRKPKPVCVCGCGCLLIGDDICPACLFWAQREVARSSWHRHWWETPE